jgi:VCBS repeat-containing protein
MTVAWRIFFEYTFQKNDGRFKTSSCQWGCQWLKMTVRESDCSRCSVRDEHFGHHSLTGTGTWLFAHEHYQRTVQPQLEAANNEQRTVRVRLAGANTANNEGREQREQRD